ncbi:methyltransferase domain-containing protein [Defluviimonas sp. WL0002]|uniref:Methyltransferase domain-containing protein n=1 Tax=Albidovulum marisflavi TaxID=2984159 RepID=A0ABT2ZCC5_9RHOB|nr:class I SAM-dependent methyltransferase [Defluviimonas sp. WL0002]MCV2868705.1 methyltransferase domain-containing protein [Defluviimonas sp. WL0002]
MQDKWIDGDGYEMYVGRWSRRVGLGFLSWLNPPPGRNWLDLGCGTGALTSQILQTCDPKSVIGVEPSEGFVALARDTTDDPRARFLQGSGEEIPLEDGAVDYAVSGLVLNFISDKQSAMAEIIRCVADGGKVAAYVWDYAGHVQFMRYFWNAAVALDQHAREMDEGVRFPVCRPQALESLFSSSGLRNVSTTAIDIVTPFEDFEDYWRPFLSGVGPAPGYCVSLDDDRREALRTRLAQILPTDPDGRILLAARAWAVRGTR